jgi:hypothetical protein
MIREATNATRLSRRLRASVAAAAAAVLVLVPASPAAAHHGWDGFETGRLTYIAGEVSSNGRWGEPHSYFDVTLDSNLPADTPELTIPEDLQAPEDSIRVNSAPSYSGSRDGLEVIIAPPAWSGRWGLARPLASGERFQAVGYINRSDDGLFRPVAFWYGEEQVSVNQVLGSTLPVRAPLRDGNAPSGVATAPSATPTVLDPLELPARSEDASTVPGGDRQAGAEDGGAETLGVWTVFGATVVAAVVAGSLYLRRSSRTRSS